MTEMEWLGSDDPAAMLAELERQALSSWEAGKFDRKQKLWLAACWRHIATYPDAGNRRNLALVVEALERRADGEEAWTDFRHVALEEEGQALRLTVRHLGGRGAAHGAALLREVFGNPFRPVHLQVDRTTRAWRFAVAGAEIIYHERVWEDMPVLADALEEAGCTDERVLMHLRGWRQFGDSNRPGWINHRNTVHARGCHVIDMILGKV